MIDSTEIFKKNFAFLKDAMPKTAAQIDNAPERVSAEAARSLQGLYAQIGLSPSPANSGGNPQGTTQNLQQSAGWGRTR